MKLLPPKAATFRTSLSPVRKKYFLELNRVCKAKGWKATDKLRHAITRQALGYDLSSSEFKPSHWDRIFATMALMADSTDLDAAILSAALQEHDSAQAAHVPQVKPGKKRPGRKYPSQYENLTEADEPGERKRLIWFITALVQPAYIESIARDLYDDVVWEELTIPKLKNLQHTLRNRLSAWLTDAKKAEGFLQKYNLEHVYFSPRSPYPWPSNEACINELLKVGKPVDLREKVSSKPCNDVVTSEPEGDSF
jgi:hypothetical protein